MMPLKIYILKTILFLLTPVFIFSCVTNEIKTVHHEPVKLAPKGKVPKASVESLITQANKAYQLKDYGKSYDYFLVALSIFESENVTKKAPDEDVLTAIGAIRSADKLNRWSESLQLTEDVEKKSTAKDSEKAEILQYKLRALTALGMYLEAVQHMHDAPQSDGFKGPATELIQSRLKSEELTQFTSKNRSGYMTAAAYVRLADLSADDRKTDQEKTFLSQAIAADPNSDAGKRASEVLNQLEAGRRVEPKTIGVVLPMGKYASISQKTLRGIEMGLGLSGSAKSTFKLAVVDSEGNPDGARRGVEKLVKEDNVIAIIGSLLSKTAPAVASKANELGVPSIALSQKAGVTELGGNVFRNALTSEMQVRALVKNAMEDQGLKQFAILYPNDAYGVEFANLFWDEVLARGGTINGAQTFSSKETDFREPIQRLVGTYYLEARADEYKKNYKEWSDQQTKKSARNTPPDDLLPPMVDFEALFIPDKDKSMGQISAMLAFNGVKGVKLLGTNLWNVPGLAKRAGNSAEEIYFVDSYSSGDPRFAGSSFIREYKTLFGEEPGPLEIQAFDAALILRTLISSGKDTREALSAELSHLENFPGGLGPLNMTPEREIQRPVTVLKLEAGNIVPASAVVKKN